MSDIRVLVVDDDEGVRGVMSRFFKLRGDNCTAVDSGAEALRLVEDRFFDLLLADIVMPGMDGVELVRRVRTLQPHTVCILMSGLGTRRDVISAIKAGAFDFVDKPIVDLAEFTMTIDRAVASSRLVQDRDALLENLKLQNARLEFSLLRLHEAFGKLRHQEEVLESDLVKAQRVQRKFLPEAFPVINGLDLFGYFGPCEHLGGDFFGVVPVSGNRLALYMADVTGHGVSAAMVTVTLRELMRTPHRRQESDFFASPATVLSFINEGLLAEAFDPPIFASMVYALFDPASGRVTVASAGHPPPLLVSGAAEHRFVPVHGTVLGVTHGAHYATTELTLDPGDILLLYSDGLPDARSATDGEFSAQRMGRIVAAQHGRPAAEVGEILEKAMLRHLDNQPPADDVTFIVACRPAAVSAVAARSNGNGDHAAAKSVKIAMPEHLRYVPPESRGRIKGGWHEQSCIIRLSGLATWQLASTLREMLAKAKAESAAAVQLDLAECEAMDSTMLGLLLQHVEVLTLHQIGSRVSAQMREMGVLDLFTISHEPCPTPDAPLAIEAAESQAPCSDLILAAHEALMEASANNQQRFKELVSTLREQQPTTPAK